MTGLRVMVTGGAGFIGANLVRALEADPAFEEIVVLDDLSSGTEQNLLDTACHFVRGSLLDAALVERTSAGIDAIVHLAAVPSVPRSIENPMRTHEVNTTGTLNVLEAARRGSAHVIVASSSSVYGSNPCLPKSEDLRPQPVSPYAVSKLATEMYALSYAQCFDLPTLAFRFFNVFGPLQSANHAYAAVIPAFISAALEDRPLPIHGDGNQSRDFTYVGTVVDTIRVALSERIHHLEPVNLAFGTRTTLNSLVVELEQAFGRDLATEHLAARAGDVRDSQADSSLLHSLLPDVGAVKLSQAISQTVAWYQAVASR